MTKLITTMFIRTTNTMAPINVHIMQAAPFFWPRLIVQPMLRIGFGTQTRLSFLLKYRPPDQLSGLFHSLSLMSACDINDASQFTIRHAITKTKPSAPLFLSLIHISEPTRQAEIS